MILQMEVWGKTLSEFGVSVFLLFALLASVAYVGKLGINALKHYLQEQRQREVEQQKREDDNLKYMRDMNAKMLETIARNTDAYSMLVKSFDNLTSEIQKTNILIQSYGRD